jgi:hypothetical protein
MLRAGATDEIGHLAALGMKIGKAGDKSVSNQKEGFASQMNA